MTKQPKSEKVPYCCGTHRDSNAAKQMRSQVDRARWKRDTREEVTEEREQMWLGER